MEGRKWEDMSTDCLVNIFGRLDIESRLLHIPAVCKPWYRAVHNPLCWQKLDFRALNDFTDSSNRYELLKIVVSLSQRCVTSLVLWDGYFTTNDLIYLSEACPSLKTLELPAHLCLDHLDIAPSFKGKWKNLEFISCRHNRIDYVVKLIKYICIYLPSFSGLRIASGDINGHIASTIVSLLPKVKHLTITDAILEKKNLLLILQGCRDLVFLDVRNCIGFDEDDEEILELSSAIKSFQCDGSTAQDSSDDDYYHCDDFDLDCPYDNIDGIEWD